MKPVLIIFLPALLLAGSCGGAKNKESTPEEAVVYRIALEEALQEERPFRLSDVADSLEYVELKTPPGMPVMVRSMTVSKDFIFIQSRGEVYQFTMSGDFVRRVGRSGRGPGEYVTAVDIVVDEERGQVSVLGGLDICHYSFDGAFLGNVKSGHNDDMLIASDSLVYASSVPFGYQTHRLLFLDNNLDTLGGIPNYDLFDMYGYTISSTMPFREPFYRYRDRVHFKGYADNDTVWHLNGLQPALHATIDMGKYKRPVPKSHKDVQAWFADHLKSGDFYQISQAQEDDGYIYLTCEPYFNPEMGAPRVMFDKASGTGFAAVTASGEAGIEDDILHGPVFWPEIITDDRYISVVEAYKLLEATEDATDLAPEFKTFLDGIDENTNTIVVMAKRK